MLAQRGDYERPYIDQVLQHAARRCALLAWQCREPVGADALRGLFGEG